MSAKNANLLHTGSHSIDISGRLNSTGADGIHKEEVYLYFGATWRGAPVRVSMSADRYAASVWDEDHNHVGDQLGAWRIVAREAHTDDPEKNGHRGAPVSGTARSALSKLCEPLVRDWLDSDEYTTSFQRAVCRAIMDYLDDRYNGDKRVSESLITFGSRILPAQYQAIEAALSAYKAFYAARAHVAEVISNG